MNLKELHSFKMSDAVKFHDQLNPLLFHGQHLDSTVRKKLLVIAEDFLNELGISQFKVKDVTISGSNAAYSYTPHSDIDLHVIVDMGQFDNDEVYQELFNAKKSVYNDKHDIKIKDIPIELYVQPASDPHVSLGEYSILNDHCIKFPLKRRANVDQNNTRAKYEQLKRLCQTALRERDLKKVGRVIKKIKQYRKAGLANFGEFGPENLAYKMVKNQEYLQKLYDLRDKLHSAKLSFETMYQNPETIKETIGPHQGKELELMLHGSKPAAIIDYSQLNEKAWQDAIQNNNWTVENIDVSKIPSPTGTVWASDAPIIIVSKDLKVANDIKRLMLVTLGNPNQAPESYHIQLGRLLGYSEEDIEHFLKHAGYKNTD
jgi:predicted nucleotidyltransferase